MRTRRKYLIGIFFLVIVATGVLWIAMLNPKSNRLSCVTNLKQIELSKQLWENDQTNKNPNAIPTWDDLRQYLPNGWSNQIPVCPSGGIYTIGGGGEPPTCSIGGPRHSLPH